jgi:hypothetical protein
MWVFVLGWLYLFLIVMYQRKKLHNQSLPQMYSLNALVALARNLTNALLLAMENLT